MRIAPAAPTMPATPQRARPRCRGRPPQLPGGQPALLVVALGDDHQRHRQGAADEEALGAGVGAEVDPVDVGGVVEQAHLDRGGHGRRDAHAEQHLEALGEAQHAQHHERPDQIELLLHRQGPRVDQRRGRRRLVEVVRPDQDEVPVAHVEQSGERVEPQARRRSPRARSPRRRRPRRAASTAAPAAGGGPGGPRTTASLMVRVWRHSPTSSEVIRKPGEDEERIDAHEPAAHERDAAVEHHHGDHRRGPHAVESGEVGQTSVRDLALVVLHRAHSSSVRGRSGPASALDACSTRSHSRRCGVPPPGAGGSLPWTFLSTTRPPTRLVASSAGRTTARPLAAPLPRRARSRSGRAGAACGAFVLVLVLVAAGVAAYALSRAPALSPLRARIVAIAQGQVGYRTDPSDTYCNKFSAYWNAGVDDCGGTATSTRSGAPTSRPGPGSRPARWWPTSSPPATSTATRPASTCGAPTTAPGTRSARATRPSPATSPSTASTPRR